MVGCGGWGFTKLKWLGTDTAIKKNPTARGSGEIYLLVDLDEGVGLTKGP